MSNQVQKAPTMRCTFTAADNTLLENYPWAGTGDIRVGTNSFARLNTGIGNEGFKISSNTIIGDGLGASYAEYIYNMGASVRKVAISVKNAVVDIGDYIGVALRVSPTATSVIDGVYVELYTANGTNKKIRISQGGVVILAATTVTLDFFTALQELVITDTGREVIAQIGTQTLTAVTTSGATETAFVLSAGFPATTAVIDNLEVWT